MCASLLTLVLCVVFWILSVFIPRKEIPAIQVLHHHAQKHEKCQAKNYKVDQVWYLPLDCSTHTGDVLLKVPSVPQWRVPDPFNTYPDEQDTWVTDPHLK